MINYLALMAAIGLSLIAAYFSVIGLTTIFAAAFWPIVVMGGMLEAAKVIAASWTYRNWSYTPFLIRAYLTLAICVLMLITSMGTFGYLSKAHADQGLVSGGALSQVALYDEKIKTAKDNIDANRKALKQMDEAVDQVMGRSSDEKGADKAVAIRRGQQKERQRLQSEIAAEQATINKLSEERAPVAAEVRKVEAEVGPLKFIAELLYDKADQEILDKTVRWVIILIVAVFDPLAVILLIAASMGLAREKKLPHQELKEAIDVFREEEARRRYEKLQELTGKIKGGKVLIDKNQIATMD
ncbi:MAG: hypothetical protein EBZ49_01160 [Proteobacteria bacterium]|nr:hypothetical protein [Pseudomonadota bacterium]